MEQLNKLKETTKVKWQDFFLGGYGVIIVLHAYYVLISIVHSLVLVFLFNHFSHICIYNL